MAKKSGDSRGRQNLRARGLLPSVTAPQQRAKSPARTRPTKVANTKKASARSTTRATPARGSRASSPKNASAYDRRNERAKELGYKSYWDQRQSRVRARKALEELGYSRATNEAMGRDPQFLKIIDELGVLGRGESAMDLFYDARDFMEKYVPAPSDSQVWSFIRTFYKPSSHHARRR